MADCDISDCDGDHLLSYTCNECGDQFCSEHRLPESHDCSALRISHFDDSDGRFAGGLQDKPGKRGMTSRDEDTGPTTSTSSSTPSTSVSADEAPKSDSDSTDDSGEINLSRHGPGTSTSSSAETNSSETATQESTTASESTTSATSPTSEQNPVPDLVSRVNLWVVGIATTAVYAVSSRVRRVLRWLWWVTKGVARLTGAGLTLVGIGWCGAIAVPAALAGKLRLAHPGTVPVGVLLVGVLLVVLTKED